LFELEAVASAAAFVFLGPVFLAIEKADVSGEHIKLASS
jgi:hypothetical protein